MTVPALKSTRNPPEAASGYGSITEKIKEAIKSSPKEYTLDDVVRHLPPSEFTREGVGQNLGRLARNGEIKVKKAGKGRRMTIYIKEATT